MTLDEFLNDYVPNVLRPMGGWGFNGRYLRRGKSCPLTAHIGASGVRYREGAARLGLTESATRTVADCADDEGWYFDYAIRARLLSGLGITEVA